MIDRDHVNVQAADVIVGCVLGALRKRNARIDDASIWRAVLREFKKPEFLVQFGAENPVTFTVASLFTSRARL